MNSSSFRVAALALALGIAAGAEAQGVTTLNIDTRDTGVDLGLQHNADGSVSARLPAGVRVGTLDSAASAAQSAGGASAGASANGAFGTTANDLAANNVRSTPGVSGGTGINNSGTSGNGLGTAASGNTGAGNAATGTTGNATAGAAANTTTNTAVDAATAAQAASTSRTQARTAVSGRILSGTPGHAVANSSNGMSLSNGGTAAAGSGK